MIHQGATPARARACKVTGCRKPVRARGLCAGHYVNTGTPVRAKRPKEPNA